MNICQLPLVAKGARALYSNKIGTPMTVFTTIDSNKQGWNTRREI